MCQSVVINKQHLHTVGELRRYMPRRCLRIAEDMEARRGGLMTARDLGWNDCLCGLDLVASAKAGGFTATRSEWDPMMYELEREA